MMFIDIYIWILPSPPFATKKKKTLRYYKINMFDFD